MQGSSSSTDFLVRPPFHCQFHLQASFMEESDPANGHIIPTTIGGKNGEPKQTTISYVAERVVGTGNPFLAGKMFGNRGDCCHKEGFAGSEVQKPRDELFLNLVMEYVPETLYGVLRHYSSVNQRMPLIYVKLYTYQLFRGLSYIHTVRGVCHRDVKPQNVLVDPLTHQVKLCDFGSAISIEYTTSIDIWSTGCVLAELLLGQPLFPGENAVGQLVEIIKVLGTPTREEIRCMNPNYTEFKFPQIKAHPWHKIFHKRMPPEAIDLNYFTPSPIFSKLSVQCFEFYIQLEACAHPFFDELRDANTRLPNAGWCIAGDYRQADSRPCEGATLNTASIALAFDKREQQTVVILSSRKTDE
ncbi:hypothetical protein ZIOFF_025307 [Zingiber officinale]|uniref:non-specific serine/threonine protein kinase n=1 Tax=Zingiber officinale TaxID=94328 RepID=A0A8J5H1D8_ZINOF|nr:hypothetical protein ZIOFF_025307 [Zingiber officinale]